MKLQMFCSVLAITLAAGLQWQCHKSTDVVPDTNTSILGDTVEIAFQQTAVFAPDSFQVRFNQILEDSRCPATVECVWAGRVHAEFTFKLGAQSVTQTLGLGSPGAQFPPASVQVFGYTVELIEVQPYPQYVAPIPAADYKVKVVVTLD